MYCERRSNTSGPWGKFVWGAVYLLGPLHVRGASSPTCHMYDNVQGNSDYDLPVDSNIDRDFTNSFLDTPPQSGNSRCPLLLPGPFTSVGAKQFHNLSILHRVMYHDVAVHSDGTDPMETRPEGSRFKISHEDVPPSSRSTTEAHSYP